MPAQKGKDLLIKIADGAGGFVAVAGLRTRQLAFNAEAVDVTNSESAGRWRELLAGAGIRRAGVTGAGVFKDDASDARMRQLFFDGAIETFQIIVPDFGRIEGSFQIAALEYGGDGIRSNAVNADGIRSGLMTDDFIRSRADAYGLSEADYMARNLLSREVTADDVAQAFLHLALARNTSGSFVTVDGGNLAAAPR